MIARLSKRLWLVVNLVLLAVAAVLAVATARDLTRVRPLPPAPAARRVQAQAPAEDTSSSPIADEKLATYNLIVAKHLFNPARNEGGGTAPPPPAAPPPPKPTLLGVVLDGPKSRAYLEDPTTKRVFGYKIGDTISGGRLDQITDEKVVIVRPDGAVDVLLRDPSKPKPPGPAASTPGAPGQPGTPQPGAAGVAPAPAQPVPGQPAPGQPPITPRALRRLPVEQPPQPPQQ
jgi:hypothetical protein